MGLRQTRRAGECTREQLLSFGGEAEVILVEQRACQQGSESRRLGPQLEASPGEHGGGLGATQVALDRRRQPQGRDVVCVLAEDTIEALSRLVELSRRLETRRRIEMDPRARLEGRSTVESRKRVLVPSEVGFHPSEAVPPAGAITAQ